MEAQRPIPAVPVRDARQGGLDDCARPGTETHGSAVKVRVFVQEFDGLGAGGDVPRLLCQQGAGEPLAGDRPYRTGRRFGECIALITRGSPLCLVL